MANFERDDVRVFDAAEDEEDVEGSRLPLLIVIALLVLAAFGAVVWLAYQRGVQQGHAEVPRTIAAEPGPAKVAPTDAGGTPTPNTGLKIYQQPAPSDSDTDAQSAPPPPTAALNPPPAAPTQTAAAAPPPAAVTPPPKPAPTQSAAVTPKPAPTPVTAPPPKPAPAPAHASVIPPPPKPAAVPPVETPAATPDAAPAGAGFLQIGSYKSEADADTAWKSYKAKHASLVGGMSRDIKSADLGAKGTWYRLRIVTASKADAVALCSKLKAEGGDCLPAK